MPTQLTRADLAAVADVHRRQARRFDLFGVAGIIGGLSLALLLMFLGDYMGWSEKWAPLIGVGGWVLGGTLAVLARRAKQRAVVDLDVACASCGAKFVSGRGQAALSRTDLIVATGSCPSCGRDFITGEA